MNPLYWPFIFNKTPVFYPFKDAPKPVAPYSHAVEAGGFVFTTGQLATGPDNDDRPNPAGFKAQTAKVMSNLNRVLKGLGLEHVMSVRVFLTHFERDYAMMNMLYASYSPTIGSRPAIPRVRPGSRVAA